MQLTMSGEYALRAMLYMCSFPQGTKFHIAEIAEKNEIPENFLRKILLQLKGAEFVKATKGNGGGIFLNKPAENVTPLEIIEAVEGSIGLNKCLIHKDFCSRDHFCSVHVIWEDAQKQLRDNLASKNMLELAKLNEERKALIH